MTTQHHHQTIVFIIVLQENIVINRIKHVFVIINAFTIIMDG